jgi:hypothetical protein
VKRVPLDAQALIAPDCVVAAPSDPILGLMQFSEVGNPI